MRRTKSSAYLPFINSDRSSQCPRASIQQRKQSPFYMKYFQPLLEIIKIRNPPLPSVFTGMCCGSDCPLVVGRECRRSGVAKLNTCQPPPHTHTNHHHPLVPCSDYQPTWLCPPPTDWRVSTLKTTNIGTAW